MFIIREVGFYLYICFYHILGGIVMKFKRRIMGILLATAIIAGGVGMNGSVA